MKKLIVYFLLLLPLFSDEFNTGIEHEIQWLKEETYVVSASRVKENIDKSAASISVIDEDMIKKMGANNLFDVLRAVPGMGSTQSNIYVDKLESRGIKAWFGEKTLIMLDGHSLNIDLLNGGATGPYKYFPIEIISRLEIIKGPASALYGENAFTSVINIITKKSADIDGTISSVKYGSNNTKTANILYGKKYDNFEFTTNVNYKDSNGDSRYVKSDAVGNSGDTNPYSDSISAYLFLKHNNGLYLKANYNETNEGPRYGAINVLNDEDYSQRETYFIELGYKKKINNLFAIEMRTYFDRFDSDNTWELYPDGFPSAVYTDGMIARTEQVTEKTGGEILTTFKDDGITVVSGVSYEQQELKDPTYFANFNPSTVLPVSGMQDFSDPSTNFISEEKRDFYAAFGEVLYDINKDVRLSLGLRYDYYDDFGSSTNPRLGATWSVNRNNNIKLIYGEAFRAPTFAELYNKNNPVLLGNIDLNPEKIKTIEVVIENKSIENLELSLTLYRSEIKNVIVAINGQYENFGKIETNGLESELKYRLVRGSYILANYTYKNSQDKNSDEDLENIASHEAYLAINYRVNKYLNIYTDANYIGSQTRSDTDTRGEIDSSIVSNITLLSDKFIVDNSTIRLSVYNIFNESGYDSASPIDFPIASRSYMAEFTYKF